MTGSEAVTDGIRVRVRTAYDEEHSDPRAPRFLFAYEITISNEGDRPAQLVSRHWRITDANGQVEEVRGPGVVGETPYLEPGASFTYQSFCPLPTDIGKMEGTYQMIRPDGSTFEAKVAAFHLEKPYAVN